MPAKGKGAGRLVEPGRSRQPGAAAALYLDRGEAAAVADSLHSNVDTAGLVAELTDKVNDFAAGDLDLDQLRDALIAAGQMVAAGQAVAAGAARQSDAELFAQTLHDVLGDRPLPAETVSRAALLAAAQTVWTDAVGPLLSASQARQVRGGISRQRLHQLVCSDRLIELRDRAGESSYPAWQFDATGAPLADLIAAHQTLVHDGHLSPWSAASWCSHEHPELDDLSPRAWAAAGRDGERLLLVAGRDAARAAQ